MQKLFSENTSFRRFVNNQCLSLVALDQFCSSTSVSSDLIRFIGLVEEDLATIHKVRFAIAYFILNQMSAMHGLRRVHRVVLQVPLRLRRQERHLQEPGRISFLRFLGTNKLQYFPSKFPGKDTDRNVMKRNRQTKQLPCQASIDAGSCGANQVSSPSGICLPKVSLLSSDRPERAVKIYFLLRTRLL